MNKPLRAVEFVHGLNAPREQFVSNIAANMARKLPSLQVKRAMLVAGGPSAADNIDEIRRLYGEGWDLFTLNGAHDWLVSLGLIPDFCVAMDACEVVDKFINNPQTQCEYFFASQCHPKLFDRLAGAYNVTIWHAALDAEAHQAIEAADPNATILAHANTVGLHSLAILYTLGFKKVRVYGMDSSHRPSGDHAYDNSQQHAREEVEFFVGDKKFLATGTFAAQAEAFARFWPQYFKLGMRIEVIGDGLLPELWRIARDKLFAELQQAESSQLQ